MVLTAGEQGLRLFSIHGTALAVLSDRPLTAALLHESLVFGLDREGSLWAFELASGREQVLVVPAGERHGLRFNHETCAFDDGEFWLDPPFGAMALTGCELSVRLRDDERDDWYAIESVVRLDLATGATRTELELPSLRWQLSGMSVPTCPRSRALPNARLPEWVHCGPAARPKPVACPDDSAFGARFDAQGCQIIGPEGVRPLPRFHDGSCMVEKGPCHPSDRMQLLSVMVLAGDYLASKHIVLDRETAALHPLVVGEWPPPALDDEALEVFGGPRTDFDLAGRVPVDSIVSGAYVGELRYLGFGELFSYNSLLVELGSRVVELDGEILGVLPRWKAIR